MASARPDAIISRGKTIEKRGSDKFFAWSVKFDTEGFCLASVEKMQAPRVESSSWQGTPHQKPVNRAETGVMCFQPMVTIYVLLQ